MKSFDLQKEDDQEIQEAENKKLLTHKSHKLSCIEL